MEIRNRGEFNSPFFTDTWVNAAINDSIVALYEILLTSDQGRYRSYSDVSITSGTLEYTLPTDFYYLISVDGVDSAKPTGYFTMERFNEDERNDYGRGTTVKNLYYYLRGNRLAFHPKPEFTLSNAVRMHYVPTPTVLSADTNTFDFHVGYDWVINDVCLKCATREGQDVSVWAMERRRAEERILNMGRLDRGSVESPSQYRNSYANPKMRNLGRFR
jgi:hypothetical protein